MTVMSHPLEKLRIFLS